MNQTRKPDFFVVGAPKSGTTSLYFYLKSHPEIFIPRRKELLFFCDDLHFNFPLLTEKEFLRYYRDVKNEKAVGEVSVWNLLSKNAARNIFEFNPDSRIIVMLRNPVDMIYSLHSNHVFNDNESIRDFEEALKAQDERKQGKQISSLIKSPVESLFYFDVADYATQVQRYVDLFPAEKIKVILFEDFISNTESVYKTMLQFLGVSENILPEFKAYNVSKTTRNHALKKLTVNPPGMIKTIGRKLFPHQSKSRDWLMETLWKANTKTAPRRELNAKLRMKLSKEFTPHIHRLEKIINRDLSAWLSA